MHVQNVILCTAVRGVCFFFFFGKWVDGPLSMISILVYIFLDNARLLRLFSLVGVAGAGPNYVSSIERCIIIFDLEIQKNLR